MSAIIPAQHYRHFYLIEGELTPCLRYFFQLTAQFDNGLLVAWDTATFFQEAPELMGQHTQFDTLSTSKLKQQLGQTHQAIFIDMQVGISASALSLIAGTIQGGGLLMLSVRDLKTWYQATDYEQARYLPWPVTCDQAKPYFKHFFMHKLAASSVTQVQTGHQTLPAPLPSIAPAASSLTLTKEQDLLIQRVTNFALTAQQNAKQDPPLLRSRLLLAHRGRGKSTALGVALAEICALDVPIKVAITGPNKAALKQLETSYQHHLEQMGLNQSDLTQTHSLFVSPDSLIHTPKALDCLIVDEAAALPLPMLMALFEGYQQVIFSSTDHGYEGAGKGFGIKFAQYLQQTSQDHEDFQLTEPVRWRQGDPLEAFIDTLLLLGPGHSPEQSTDRLIGRFTGHSLEETSPIEEASPLEEAKPSSPKSLAGTSRIQAQDWQTQYPILQDFFGLLVSAHYQTSPDDIRWLLDDPSVSSYVTYQDNRLISGAILTQEGPLDPHLALEVAQGTRRPRGHLVPQSLLAHEGHLNAGAASYWRISRIATLAAKQNTGFASKLLEEIAQAGKKAKIDFLCASFAASPAVLRFWQKNGFICVRLGTARDQASGCYSVMMLKGLEANAHTLAQNLHHHYLANAQCNLARDYPSLSTELKALLLLTQDPQAIQSEAFLQAQAEKDQEDLALFAHHHRPFETIRAQLTRRYHAWIQSQTNQEHKKNVIEASLLKETALLKEAAEKGLAELDFTPFALNSKKAIQKALRQAVAKHLV